MQLTVVETLQLVDSDFKAEVVPEDQVDASVAAIGTSTIMKSEAYELGVQGSRLGVAGEAEHHIHLTDNSIVRGNVET